jgi:peptide-methionine (S)-S-oxide reductase
MSDNDLEKATFAGGCFWCMQGPFDALDGVISTEVGYTGGAVKDPSYEQVSTGTTGHAESIEISFDPKKITYQNLLDVFWRNIDPTTFNGQFADQGSQYRTAIFYHNNEQRLLAEESKRALSQSAKFSKPIVTEIVPAGTFFRAEDYHQHYHRENALHYGMYKKASGRASFIEKNWQKTSPLLTKGKQMDLKERHCAACQGNSDVVSEETERSLLAKLFDWRIDIDNNIHKLTKTVKSETFMNAVNLLREIAVIADSENHHPDLHLYYNKLVIVLYTHKVNGLTDNDFILAAKIDDLLEKVRNS